jgi:hypothetical protein
MGWNHPYTSAAEVVFDSWRRRIHGDAFAARFERDDAPGDPAPWMVERDQLLYPKDANFKNRRV